MKESEPSTHEAPSPLYKNDLAWTKDRQERVHNMHQGVSRGTLSQEDALKQTEQLIDEVSIAVRENPKMQAGSSIVEASVMLQELLYSFYDLAKKLKKNLP